MSLQTITPDRLKELRGALAKLDPDGRKRWLLEVYELRDGEHWLADVIDIKTGRPLKVTKGLQEIVQ
jgi:hypothetical protein